MCEKPFPGLYLISRYLSIAVAIYHKFFRTFSEPASVHKTGLRLGKICEFLQTLLGLTYVFVPKALLQQPLVL